MENFVGGCDQSKDKSLKHLKSQKQQPGKHLCVDTRKEPGIVALTSHKHPSKFSETRTPFSVHKTEFRWLSSEKGKLPTVNGDLPVQPDSLCKLKTNLAINYVQGLLETAQPVPIQRKHQHLKKGHLKPLLVNQLNKEPRVTKCLGIQNDRCKKTVVLEDGMQLPLEAFSPGSTRFSSALRKDNKFVDVDLRRLSLADPNSIEMENDSFWKETERNYTGNNLKFNGKSNDNQCEDISKEDDVLYYTNSNYNPDEVNESDQINDDRNCYPHSNGRDGKSIQKELTCFDRSPNYTTTADTTTGMFQEFHTRQSESFVSDTSANESNFPVMKTLRDHYTTSPSPELNTVQVKDIWKALTESGFDISREEVSRYKANTTTAKTRIKSAPVRRREVQTFTCSRNVRRARSAHGRNDTVHSEKDRESGDPAKDCETGGFGSGTLRMEDPKEKIDYNPSCKEDLEVVARSKPVSTLPRKKKSGEPLIPPLNFKINTRPRPGYFFYFAYGLNMNQKRLEIQLRCKSGVRYWGVLFGFRLIFNRKGSSEGGVGFPNIVAESGFSVEGCVYELPQDCLPLLDICVGFPKHYARLVLPVWLCNSLKPDEYGVAQHCVPSVVYVAQDEWVVSDPSMLDSSFTFKQCSIGTNLLTPNYQEFFSSFMNQ